MKVQQRGLIVSVGVAFLAMGCGGVPPDQGPNQGPDQGTATPAEHGAAAAKTSGIQVFKDPTPSGPRLDVYDVDGNLGISVSGPIGTEVPEPPAPTATLTEVYRSLHPAADIPAELAPLDARLALLRRAVPSAKPIVTTPAIVKKDSTAFYANACQTFAISQTRSWVPVECNWTAVSACEMFWLGGTYYDVGYYPVQSGEIVFMWNNVNVEGFVKWYNSAHQRTYFIIPAYTWTWTSWTAASGPFEAIVGTNNDCYLTPGYGDIGITHHVWSDIVK